MIRAYLFALDPTAQQAAAMQSHCGAARLAYNWCLARVLANWSQRQAEESYGVPEGERTPWIDASFYSLRKAWNAAKPEAAPWWRENSKEAYATGCANLAAALNNHRLGNARMPRFKSKRRSRPSCHFSTAWYGWVHDRRHVKLPVIGVVRTHESTRKLARRIESGEARVLSATLTHQRGRWHVALCAEVSDGEIVSRVAGRVVGVDLGISTLATLSTGEHVPNGRRLDGAIRELRRAQRACARRRGPDRRAGLEPSARWQKARTRVGRIHTRVANLRRNDTHQLTTRLVRDYDVIAIEDLHVGGMLRNRSLARHISGAAWSEIRRQFTYKSKRAGVQLVVADRWFASSKTCSECGAAKTKLALSVRTFACQACGIVLDRDENAARNLAALAAVDTGELRREQPDRTDVRPAQPAAVAVGSLREGSTDSTSSPRGDGSLSAATRVLSRTEKKEGELPSSSVDEGNPDR